MVKLVPVFKDYLWGGTRLKENFHKNSELPIVAESWELSVHPDGKSKVEEEGKLLELDEFLNRNPGYLGRNCPDGLPILIKFIDARQSLSIQVHPDEAYARKYENDHGKTEMWYVVDADEGSFIYFGVKERISREAFKAAIEENRVLDCLKKVYCHKGDYFLIREGTIHAIGAGLLICEIQKNSNATYRVYDFDRRDAHGNKRQLHVDKALDVSVLTPLEDVEGHVEGEHTEMVDCEYFHTSYHQVHGDLILNTHEDSFTSLTFLEGEGEVAFEDQKMCFMKGDSFLLPAGLNVCHLTGCGSFILTTVGKE